MLESVGDGSTLERLFGVGDGGDSGIRLDGGVGDAKSRSLQLDVAYFDEALPTDAFQLEAIVQITGRPPLLIQNGSWETPFIDAIRLRLEGVKAKLAPA